MSSIELSNDELPDITSLIEIDIVNKIYSCLKCKFVRKDDRSVIKHIEDTHEYKKFYCRIGICDIFKSTERKIMIHRKTPHEPPVLTEIIDNESLPLLDDMIRNDDKKVICVECDFTRVDRRSVVNHIGNTHLYKKFHCNFIDCGFNTHNEIILSTHKKIHYTVVNIEVSNDELPMLDDLIIKNSDGFKCSVCNDYDHKTKQNAVNHITKNHVNSYKRIYCRFTDCESDYFGNGKERFFGHSEEMVKKHSNAIHKEYTKPEVIVLEPEVNERLPLVEDLINEVNKKEYTCKECDDKKIYESRAGIVYHIEHKHSHKRFYCEFPECIKNQYSAYSDRSLKNHEEECHKDYVRPVVEVDPEDNESLPTVEEIFKLFNEKDGNFQCHICLDKYRSGKDSAKSPKEHITRKHSDLHKKFYCTYYGCDFNKNYENLVEYHMRTHFPGYKDVMELINKIKKDKDDKYICTANNCIKPYNNIKSLKVHIWNDHNESPITYTCEVEDCKSTPFKDKNLLKRHIEGVHGERNLCDVEGCISSFSHVGSLLEHMRLHDPNFKPISCELCNENFSRKPALFTHHNRFHNPNSKKFYCGVENCSTYRNDIPFLSLSELERHQKEQHIGVVVQCDKCPLLYGSEDALKFHKKIKHNPNLVTFTCHVENCNKDDHIFTRRYNLNTHLREIHNILVYMFMCDILVDGSKCCEEFFTLKHLKKHKEIQHDIDIKWFDCEVCNKQFEFKNQLKIHRQNKHDIDIIWVDCPLDGCDFKCKQHWWLMQHLRGYHDQGKNTCDICQYDTQSSYKYTYNKKALNICKTCYNNVNGKKLRIETVMSNYLDEISYLEPFLVGSDKSFKSIGGCSSKRPDKIYMSPDLVLWIECDENQHSSNSYSCDEKRIMDAYDEILGCQLVIIRWNPHSYKPVEGKQLGIQERLQGLSDIISKIITNPPEDLIYMYYMYYDKNSKMFAKNIKHELIQ
jgi:hypothetical protein